MTFAAPAIRGPAPPSAEREDSRLEVLGEVARLVDEGGWPAEGFERLIDLLVPQVADAAAIDLADEGGRASRLGAKVAGDAELSEWLAGREPRADQIEEVEAALREGDWRLIQIDGDLLGQIAKDNEDARRLAEIGASWWVNLPLGAGATLLGSLGLGLRAERGDPNEQRQFLEALAERVARGLVNTHLVAELRRTRRRLEAVLDAMSEAVIVCDDGTEVVYANAAAAALLKGDGFDVVREVPLDEAGSYVVKIIESPTP
jgi:PAS domain-containing protein